MACPRFYLPGRIAIRWKEDYLKQSRAMPVIATATLCCACVTMAFVCSRYRVPDIHGVWEDAAREYSLIFQDNGMYRESVYNAERPYEVTGDTLVMHDQLGNTLTLELTPTKDGALTLPLNGTTRTLTQSRHTVKLSSDVIIPQSVPASEVYCLDTGVTLKLWDSNNVYSISASEVPQIVGKWAKDATNGELILFGKDGTPLDVFKHTGFGYAVNEMSMHVQAESIEANAVELAGYRLTGFVEDKNSRLQYRFKAGTNVVERTSPGGEVIEFVYGMDANGLVSMVDMVGKGVTDSLWIDLHCGEAYRYVFEYDGWHQYLAEIGGVE